MSEAPRPILEYGTPAAQGRLPLLGIGCSIGAICIGLAIQLGDGEYSPPAMALITAAILATIAGMLLPVIPAPLRSDGDRLLTAILGAGLALQTALLASTWPGVDLPHTGPGQLALFYGIIAVATLITGLLLFDRVSRSRCIWLPLFLAASCGLFAWMIRSSPNPHIDVWVFQQGAAAELLRGHNPYAMTFPDIYHSTLPGHQPVYGPGLVVNDRLQFGVPYPPVSVLLATIGYAIAGDHRYAQAAALVLAGLFMGYSRGGRISLLAAALVLLTPRVLFVLGRAWTEPFGVMLLALTIWCACHRSRWTPIALGLFLSTKQYMIFALPLTFLLLPRGWRWIDWLNLLRKAALTAAIVTLPLALWNFPAFWKSTVTVQERSPFRWDALSYLVWYGFRGHLVTEPFTAVFWSTLAAMTTLALCLWRAPRSPAGFAASVAVVLLAFFSFNKQAFCNYYFFVIGALGCAIAACASSASEELAPPNIHSAPVASTSA